MRGGVFQLERRGLDMLRGRQPRCAEGWVVDWSGWVAADLVQVVIASTQNANETKTSVPPALL